MPLLLAQTDAFWHIELRSAWPPFLVLVGIGLAVALAIYVYHDRASRIGRVRQVLLTALRAIVLALVIVMLFQPVLAIETAQPIRRNVLVMLDTSSSMAIADNRTSPEDRLVAAKMLGRVPLDADAAAVTPAIANDVATATRVQLAQAMLMHEQADAFAQLDEHHKTRYFTFGTEISAVGSDGPATRQTLQDASADAPATRVGSALEQVVANYGGQPIAGIVLLTDGASNLGVAPTQVARQLGQQNVPLFPIGIGLPDPPDIHLRRAIVPETVFLKDRVPLRVEIASTGFAGQPVDVTAILGGETVATETLTLRDGTQFVELPFTPERRTGTAELQVVVSQLPGETSIDNNQTARPIRIIDEKIKVLYVEGSPRWEYRYLRQVLLRDHRLDVQFLMTEGDRELAAGSDLFLESFPDTAGEAYDYDLIILGDVPADYFTTSQLVRMQEAVQKTGASLLMLGGRRHAGSYLGTPIEPVLPVRLAGRSTQEVREDVTPVVTAEGRRSAFVQLTSPPPANQALWNLVHPLYEVPRLDGAKPGATVLLTLSDEGTRREPYPLIAWHRYGSGRSLYVGTDQLWRLRFKRGDEFHARFWGQAIQFLTLSRLLGENRRVRIELPASQFNVGERIPISVNALNEAYEPILDEQYRLDIYLGAGRTPMQTLALEAVPGIPGLYQGTFTPGEPGSYRIASAGADLQEVDPVEIRVQDAPLEQLDPAMQRQTLEEMAQLSGGQYIEIADLARLPEMITGETRHVLIRREEQLWDHWAIFMTILALASAEWLIRRQSGLV